MIRELGNAVWVILSLLIVIRLLNNLVRTGYLGIGDIYRKALAERMRVEKPILAKALSQPHRLESSMQMLDAVCLVAVASVVFLSFGISLATVALLATYAIFADVVLPNYLARHHTEAFLVRLYPLIRWFFVPFALFANLTHFLAEIGERYEEKRSDDEEETPEEINAYIEAGTEEGWIEEKQRALVQNILNIDETVAREIMTPRTDMRCVPITMDRADVLDTFKACSFSRLPVYSTDIDSIEGIIRLKDLVNHEEETVAQLVMPILYVQEDLSVADLLEEMLRTRIQMAVVLDPYHGTSGLITLEDVIEEIVGEIHDEHETPDSDEIIQQGDGSYLLDGRIHVDDFEQLFHVELSNDDVDTIGGHIFTTLGRIPDVGTQIDLAGISVEIVRADDRRIYQLRATPAVVDDDQQVLEP
ncbi:MAG: HlyC/CorC family transporter [Acidobacteria bacterium]|nr:HlyC/CorC family transporter [Acidobacteriota bacterium]